jgi:membrane protein
MQSPKVPALLQTEFPEDWYGIKGSIYAFVQLIYSVSVNFIYHKGSLRAAALTYTTILSIVPFTAIVFSMLKGLGVQNALEPFLRQIAGDSEETISRLINYVNNTNVRSIGVIGLLMLVLTVNSLMTSIEDAFNSILGVRNKRSAKRRFSDYLSVVFVGSILLFVSTSITSALQSQWILRWLVENTYFGGTIMLFFHFIPYVSIWIAMSFLYIFIPNTKIDFASAVIGGVVAGTAWVLAQWGYFHFQIGVANYNAIYGTLAAVPVFLVWIYTSWLIVLFGLEIVFVHHYRSSGLPQFGPISLSVSEREQMALALLVQVNLHFIKGGNPPSARLLSDELNFPLLSLEVVFDELEQLGYLVTTNGNNPGWLPACDSSGVNVSDVVGALRGVSEPHVDSPVLQIVEDLVRKGWYGNQACLAGITLHDLVCNVVTSAEMEL